MESSHRNSLSYPLCTVLSFLLGFFLKKNECDVLHLETDKPLGIRFHHRLKQDVFRSYAQHLTESVLLQTCFSLFIHIMRDSVCFQVQLQTITIYIQSQPLTWSHQRCTLIPFSFWILSFEACISESNSYCYMVSPDKARKHFRCSS